jgi:hypothetical protein
MRISRTARGGLRAIHIKPLDAALGAAGAEEAHAEPAGVARRSRAGGDARLNDTTRFFKAVGGIVVQHELDIVI